MSRHHPVVRALLHVRVRSGPGEAFRVIGHLARDARVEAVEHDPHGGPWVYVKPGGGWVRRDHLVRRPGP